jgi:ATP-dependent DNA helicase PIF1
MSFFYAVKKGHTPNIYTSWEDCEKQINGFSGSEFKKFKTSEEATLFMTTTPVTATSTNIVESQQQLSLEQQIAFNKYKRGHNVFITGPGGTGKSHLVKTIKSDLESRGVKHAVCALTGCAAVLLNCCAKTIHSFAGIGLCAGEIHDVVDKVIRNRRACANWKTTHVLIIDEVSMLSTKVFEVLNKVAQVVRKNHSRPFGGMQVIFIGDFYQLPPVGRYTEPETTMFCFQSPQWHSVFQLENHVVLKTLFRQKDAKFIQVLEEVRQGVLSPESVEILQERKVAKFAGADGIVPTKLFPVNSDADRVNQIMYMKLKNEEHIYGIESKRDFSTYVESATPIPVELMALCETLSKEDAEQQLSLFVEVCKLSTELRLKKGAFVMCLANLDVDGGICNGSQGVIDDFVAVGGKMIPVVRFVNGVSMRIFPKVYQHGDYPRLGVQQLPLRLAWAFTIHKSQGITLDYAEMDLGSRVFECGQSYVGLSRVRSLEGLFLSEFDPRKIKTNPIVSEFYGAIPVAQDESISSSVCVNESAISVSAINVSSIVKTADFSRFAYSNQGSVKVLKLP